MSTTRNTARCLKFLSKFQFLLRTQGNKGLPNPLFCERERGKHWNSSHALQIMYKIAPIILLYSWKSTKWAKKREYTKFAPFSDSSSWSITAMARFLRPSVLHRIRGDRSTWEVSCHQNMKGQSQKNPRLGPMALDVNEPAELRIMK